MRIKDIKLSGSIYGHYTIADVPTWMPPKSTLLVFNVRVVSEPLCNTASAAGTKQAADTVARSKPF
jgi:hypothetical protein